MGQRKTRLQRILKPLFKRFLVLILCLLLGGLCACTEFPETDGSGQGMFFDSGRDDAVPLSHDADGSYTAVSLVQAVALAINDNGLIPAIFETLPSYTTDALSEEDFRRYVEALSPVNGEKINSFELVPKKEKEEYAAMIAEIRPELKNMAENSQYYALKYEPKDSGKFDDAENGQNIVAIQFNDKGKAFFSGGWVKSVISLHDFAAIYFDAIQNDALKEKEYDALAFLLEQGEKPFQYGSLKHYSMVKAEKTAAYYRSKVTTAPSASFLLYILPGKAVYLQDYRYGSRLSGVREVTFFDRDGLRTVKEEIPVILNEQESKVCVMGQPLFKDHYRAARVQISEKDIHPLAGPILSISDLGENDAGRKTFAIDYYGLRMVIIGNADPLKKSWTGVVESLDFTSSIFSMGAAVSVGMTEEDLYSHYPFLADNDNIMRTTNGVFSRMKVHFEADGGVIKHFIFERAN